MKYRYICVLLLVLILLINTSFTQVIKNNESKIINNENNISQTDDNNIEKSTITVSQIIKTNLLPITATRRSDSSTVLIAPTYIRVFYRASEEIVPSK